MPKFGINHGVARPPEVDYRFPVGTERENGIESAVTLKGGELAVAERNSARPGEHLLRKAVPGCVAKPSGLICSVDDPYDSTGDRLVSEPIDEATPSREARETDLMSDRVVGVRATASRRGDAESMCRVDDLA